MLDNIILAYRNKFYDWNLKEISEFYLKSKKLFWGITAVILVMVGLMIYGIVSHLNIILYIITLVELILGIIADRLTVKQYQKYISSKQEHIKDVICFLKTTIPNSNLYSKNQIEYLINLLTTKIESKAPFNKFKASLSNFGKTIIIPIITYIAGIYAGNLSKMEFNIVIGWSIIFIIIIGFCYIIFSMLAQGLKKITLRNYDAAIALREDLLDIKLLYFISNDR